MLPVRWDALKESNLAHTVYKGGLLAHPNKGVKSLAESLCKQWTDAAPVKKPRYVKTSPLIICKIELMGGGCEETTMQLIGHTAPASLCVQGMKDDECIEPSHRLGLIQACSASANQARFQTNISAAVVGRYLNRPAEWGCV